MQYITLRNWAMTALDLDGGPASGYTAPERMDYRLVGNVYGHPNQPRHYDGKSIVTSSLAGYDEDLGLFLTASGSRYKLENPDPSYEAQFPGALDRVIAQAKKLNGKVTIHEHL